MGVSVIIPVYNEAKILYECVKKCKDKFDKNSDRYEIIIVEDFSDDQTAAIADKLTSNNIKTIHNQKRIGKGASIANGIKEAKYDTVIFMDVDLSADLDCVDRLVNNINNGADIVVGSRFLPESKVKRSFVRDFASKGYNLFVRVLLGSKIKDHQCGFKAFKKSKVLGILDQVKDKKWFWDTEILVLAQKKGLYVEEIPITWKAGANSKINLLFIIPEMFVKAILMRMKY